jgi:putative Mg2+ transporter-C (MgtC) family protein
MVTSLDWHEIALRLALTLLAGGLLGFNRVERGRAAGLRTTMLVSLTASVGMILTITLIHTSGKAADSFVTMDVMRIPLGLLDGMGFIGAGAIFRRDDLVVGVTTAATLWIATMIGLCVGAGHITLGLSATALGAGILWGLHWVEGFVRQHRSATLSLVVEDDAREEEVRGSLARSGFRIAAQAVTYILPPRRRVSWDVEWEGRANEARRPGFVGEIAAHPDVTEVEWKTARSSSR